MTYNIAKKIKYKLLAYFWLFSLSINLRIIFLFFLIYYLDFCTIEKNTNNKHSTQYHYTEKQKDGSFLFIYYLDFCNIEQTPTINIAPSTITQKKERRKSNPELPRTIQNCQLTAINKKTGKIGDCPFHQDSQDWVYTE